MKELYKIVNKTTGKELDIKSNIVAISNYDNVYYYDYGNKCFIDVTQSYRIEWLNQEPKKEKEEMKEFLNEGKKKFSELSDEEKLIIIKSAQDGNCESFLNNEWVVTSRDVAVFFYCVYRTKPKKKLEIPWSFIDKKWKYAYLTKDGSICFTIGKPSLSYSEDYFMYSGKHEFVRGVLNIDTDGIDWKDSVVQRGEN